MMLRDGYIIKSVPTEKIVSEFGYLRLRRYDLADKLLEDIETIVNLYDFRHSVISILELLNYIDDRTYNHKFLNILYNNHNFTGNNFIIAILMQNSDKVRGIIIPRVLTCEFRDVFRELMTCKGPYIGIENYRSGNVEATLGAATKELKIQFEYDLVSYLEILSDTDNERVDSALLLAISISSLTKHYYITCSDDTIVEYNELRNENYEDIYDFTDTVYVTGSIIAEISSLEGVEMDHESMSDNDSEIHEYLNELTEVVYKENENKETFAGVKESMINWLDENIPKLVADKTDYIMNSFSEDSNLDTLEVEEYYLGELNRIYLKHMAVIACLRAIADITMICDFTCTSEDSYNSEVNKDVAIKAITALAFIISDLLVLDEGYPKNIYSMAKNALHDLIDELLTAKVIFDSEDNYEDNFSNSREYMDEINER